MKSHGSGIMVIQSVALLVILLAPGSPGGPQPVRAQAKTLIADGNFESDANVAQLRAQEKSGGWYESRKDGKIGPKLLKLSRKPVGGNTTRKAMLKGSAKLNTYLTQELAQPQSGRFSLKWDIYVSKIQKAANRSAFQLIGNAQGKGPNAGGPQRFVFLAFQNSKTPGKVDLIAMDGQSPQTANQQTVIARDLSLKKWYTIRVEMDVTARTYAVSIPGVTGPAVTVKAYNASGKGAPTTLTHLSFASWNDGPGTFYVDNVAQP